MVDWGKSPRFFISGEATVLSSESGPCDPWTAASVWIEEISVKIISSGAIWLLLFCSAFPDVAWAVETHVPHHSLADWTDPLSKTVIRYFEGQPQFLPGDLIVRSQVADLQDYLRKTQKASPATMSPLCRRVLPDRACLARVFYSLGSDQLLREAARNLGGYGPLDRLCQSKAGRERLTTAIRQADIEMLLGYARKHELSPEPVRVSKSKAGDSPVARKLSKIYTVEDLLKALHAEVPR